MNRTFLLTALIFSAFMCCQNRSPKQETATEHYADKPAEISVEATAESLEVARARFQKNLAQARAIVRERNASPQVITPSNPTRDILSKRENPPQ